MCSHLGASSLSTKSGIQGLALISPQYLHSSGPSSRAICRHYPPVISLQAVRAQHEGSPVKMVSHQPATLTIKQGSKEEDVAKKAVKCKRIIFFYITVGVHFLRGKLNTILRQ